MTLSSQTVVFVCQDKPWLQDSVKLIALGRVLPNLLRLCNGEDLYGIAVDVDIPSFYGGFSPQFLLGRGQLSPMGILFELLAPPST